ncbi:MAG TPA: biopolymer transporter ExbD [Candidatus Limnocylindria bacterium]|jgi:biopolymer transport protein ExbD|nr:biopolymer transporter ExbD [Candidatus Limnocylindria bacterium]
MKFYIRKRRQAPAIIIISLIDVLIVMVIFLLVTTTFKNQPSVALKLPESSDALKKGASQEKPPLIITIARSEPRFYLGKRAVNAEKLLAELRAAVTNDPQTKLVLRADGESTWQDVIKVIDSAKQAGIHASNVRAFTRGAREGQ